jgi:hypothetical protein
MYCIAPSLPIFHRNEPTFTLDSLINPSVYHVALHNAQKPHAALGVTGRVVTQPPPSLPARRVAQAHNPYKRTFKKAS